MAHIDLDISVPVDAFVTYLCTQYDYTPATDAEGRVRTHTEVAYPDDSEARILSDTSWQIGCIYGPSGSGKTRLLHRFFGEITTPSAPNDVALVSAIGATFGYTPPDAIKLLTSVGLRSVHDLLKPSRVLSVGQRARFDTAAALASAHQSGKPCVIDEYTSTVNRAVAEGISVGISRYIRRTPGLRFIACGCHRDVIPWLKPDWVLDLTFGDHPEDDLALTERFPVDFPDYTEIK